ncbi:protein tyrosine phosphatase [Vitiosangium sp. GDMCC 1.1324]|uniref:phosphatase domain-containing protein n=1 Tax=Vitiosangium sp. (strain GDMCC 1.1324) TaxID=2138576 RepID=UPI000D3D81CE|nr:protein tyrosine phosphatase [Vitiosangium sp. GDMCC 1.1324]PTL75749.1 protein tyrosine phosphatase [Vitiosangium sp. GDMCC 1.1324]
MLLPPLAPNASFAPLVLDSDEPQARRFRMSAGFEASRSGETHGPPHCSGSAQFSLAGWDDIQERLGRPAPERLYVVDLRQETHGFLDGAAVSWYARHNWGCVGLAGDEVRQLEGLRLRLLARAETVWVGDARAIKEGREPHFTEWKPGHVRTEQEALGLPEGHYLRLPVTDHLRPDDAVIDRFIHFVRDLRSEAHLHFHCRGGKGRTSLFLTLLELLWNAEHVALEAILERQQRFNDYDLRKRPAPDSYKAAFAPERLELLTRFHGYARANPGGGPLSWTQWLQSERSP